MLLFKFLTGKPWIYVLAGLAFFSLMCYSIYDVNRGGNIPAFDDLGRYSGMLIAVTPQRQSLAFTREDGTQQLMHYYELTVLLDSPVAGGEKKWVVFVNRELYPDMQVVAYVAEGKKERVYHLIADDEVILDYDAAAQYAFERAQRANEALTKPLVLAVIAVLIIGGTLGQFFQMRRRALYRKMQQEQTNHEAGMPLI